MFIFLHFSHKWKRCSRNKEKSKKYLTLLCICILQSQHISVKISFTALWKNETCMFQYGSAQVDAHCPLDPIFKRQTNAFKLCLLIQSPGLFLLLAVLDVLLLFRSHSLLLLLLLLLAQRWVQGSTNQYVHSILRFLILKNSEAERSQVTNAVCFQTLSCSQAALTPQCFYMLSSSLHSQQRICWVTTMWPYPPPAAVWSGITWHTELLISEFIIVIVINHYYH